MPGAQWFPGATLNYVSQIFRHAVDDRPAMIVAGEDGSSEWSWSRLRRETAAFAAYLRSVGVEPGDRVVGYLPNIGEAVAAFLGAASVGATWAVCNQDLSVGGVVARLGQLEPTVLVASDGSVYAGKRRDRHAELAEIRSQLPTLKATVLVPRLGESVDDTTGWAEVLEARRGGRTRDHARSVRPPAVGAVLLGHHRHAEGHRARARRSAARTREIPEPAIGSEARGPLPLAVEHQLDDVEPAGVRVAGRLDDRAVRRQPDLRPHRLSLAGGR